jgi:hypothetical protein
MISLQMPGFGQIPAKSWWDEVKLKQAPPFSGVLKN